ncbi:MAG TPA: ATP-binding protein [Novosphingobium sp.]|nr:ATP-binding protein [Novosphingobium sp.]
MTPLSLPSRLDPRNRGRLGAGLPLGMQMIALLVCALLTAQLVTLALTVLFPPEAPRQWDLAQVAQALSGGPVANRLERQRMAGPPDLSAPGWLVSQSSREALARQLGRDNDAVVLAFYTQLPVGGVAVPASTQSPLAQAEPVSAWGGRLALIPSAHAQSGPASPGGHMPGGGFPGGFPGGGFPGGSFPGGPMPGGHMPGGLPGGKMPGGRMPGGMMPGSGPGGASAGSGHTPSGNGPGGQPPAQPGAPAGSGQGGTGGTITLPAREGGPLGGIQGGPGALSAITPITPMVQPVTLPATPGLSAPVAAPSGKASVAQPLPRIDGHTLAHALATPAGTLATPVAAPVASSAPEAGKAAAGSNATPLATASEKPQPIPFRHAGSGTLAASGAPFIEGDFIAATRNPDGSWTAVAPAAEPFPNRWQTQVMLWFVLSLAIVSPLAWLFARRIVRPLEGFAQAAEALGRDPSATIMPLSGPAEIGRAAYAFNQMRYRLRAFVDDRTAMVGAISHDLRTPLTRLRFRIEDVPEPIQPGLLKEVTEMEQMIAHVIAFIRDASTPGKREIVDLVELVEGSVRDAKLIGGAVEFEAQGHFPVEVDPVGIRRLLGNLLENAVKYGDHARVRLTMLEGEAVAEVIDNGPGIPEAEWDHVFEPFYRTEAARKSGKPGSGLGLAVCRSIARAHGGDVALGRAPEGFVARVSVPLLYAERRAA